MERGRAVKEMTLREYIEDQTGMELLGIEDTDPRWNCHVVHVMAHKVGFVLFIDSGTTIRAYGPDDFVVCDECRTRHLVTESHRIGDEVFCEKCTNELFR